MIDIAEMGERTNCQLRELYPAGQDGMATVNLVNFVNFSLLRATVAG